jgi:hypothetical protein
MTLKFSQYPGYRERHLKRRHENPLFGNPPPQASPQELESARLEDAREAALFQAEFAALIQQAVALKANEDSDVILRLKERLDQAYEQASGLSGDQSKIKDAIRKLVVAIMGAVRRGAGDDSRAMAELEQEDAARSLHYGLLEHPLVADILAPDSPIGAEELVPSLLSEEPDALHAAMHLFDRIQLASLVAEGRALLERRSLESCRLPGAWERLADIERELLEQDTDPLPN